MSRACFVLPSGGGHLQLPGNPSDEHLPGAPGNPPGLGSTALPPERAFTDQLSCTCRSSSTRTRPPTRSGCRPRTSWITWSATSTTRSRASSTTPFTRKQPDAGDGGVHAGWVELHVGRLRHPIITDEMGAVGVEIVASSLV